MSKEAVYEAVDRLMDQHSLDGSFCMVIIKAGPEDVIVVATIRGRERQMPAPRHVRGLSNRTHDDRHASGTSRHETLSATHASAGKRRRSVVVRHFVNRLSSEKRIAILKLMVEGVSIRSIGRAHDVSPNTIDKLLRDVGRACFGIHDQEVREVAAERIQTDEIWSFCYAKRRNVATARAAPPEAGDAWTWLAIDPDTKLLVSWFVGDRSSASASVIMADLKARLQNRVQLTTDGHRAYLEAVEDAFGDDVDFAQLVKMYAEPPAKGQARYSPGKIVAAKPTRITGSPDPDHISTSIVKRLNLTVRMTNRRFTRLTNAFSKRLKNHIHALAIDIVHYNFIRIHKTPRVTPAMAAGITDRLWTWEDVLERTDALATAPRRPKTYRPRTRSVMVKP